MVEVKHWTMFIMLDGSVYLRKDPLLARGRDIHVPRMLRDGTVEVAFLTAPDRECKELDIEGVHVHYIRYFEIHPPTLEGATIH